MDTVGLRVPTKQIRDFTTCNVRNVSRLQQGASRLQTASANLWTFSINITSPLRIRFPLFNPTELRHHRVAYIVLLPRIRF
jgi:hypothetical protein